MSEAPLHLASMAVVVVSAGKATDEVSQPPRKVDVRLPGKGNSNSQWREAGPPNHHDDKVQ